MGIVIDRKLKLRHHLNRRAAAAYGRTQKLYMLLSEESTVPQKPNQDPDGHPETYCVLRDRVRKMQHGIKTREEPPPESPGLNRVNVSFPTGGIALYPLWRLLYIAVKKTKKNTQKRKKNEKEDTFFHLQEEPIYIYNAKNLPPQKG